MADAAEYALRIDDAKQRERSRIRMRHDPEFRSEAELWEEALGAFLTDVQEIAPPAKLKRMLDKRLFGTWPSPLQRFLPWLAGGALGAALAAAVALAIIPTLAPEQPANTLVAELSTDGDQVRILAAYDAASQSFRATLTSGSAAEGRDFELWAIAPDSAPVSLGVIRKGATFALPEALAPIAADLTLAVSDEPLGGSPTGTPSNVLAASPVTSI